MYSKTCMFRLRNIDYHGQASKLICWKHYHVRNKISKEQSSNDSNSKTSKLTMRNMMVKVTNTINLESFSCRACMHDGESNGAGINIGAFASVGHIF